MTGKVGSRERGVGDIIFGSKHRIEAFDILTSMVPFEVGVGMVGEHAFETDITRCHQVF